MKLLIYSDLHLEFCDKFRPPENSDADVMILAGDIITFRDMEPLKRFLEVWRKPVIYVTGNHEYYTKSVMARAEDRFKDFSFYGYVERKMPWIYFLKDESIALDGVNFFGGTMWTDFRQRNPISMQRAQRYMNDYVMIKITDTMKLTTAQTVSMHERYRKNLVEWFQMKLEGPRIVISHHAPVINPNSAFLGSDLIDAYVATDMREIIEEYQPDVWVYGHCVDMDTEILTTEGWKMHGSISKNNTVYSYNPATKLVEHDQIKRLVLRPNYNGDVYEYNNRKISVCATEDHNMVYYNTTKSKFLTLPAHEFFQLNQAHVVQSGTIDNAGVGLRPRMLELYIAIAADGSVVNTDLVRFSLEKQRKAMYITSLLSFLGISFKQFPADKRGRMNIHFTLPDELKGLTIKGLDKKLLMCNQADCAEILAAYENTDGRRYRHVIAIYTSKRSEKDLLQHIFTINGYSSTCHTRLHGFAVQSENKNPSHCIYVRKSTSVCLQKCYNKNRLIVRRANNETFWCIENTNHNFFIRRRGKIMLIGNTHECDDQMIGKTRIVSNQRGYPRSISSRQDDKFDPNGLGIVV